MLSGSPLQSIGYPKIKATPEMGREMLQVLGMGILMTEAKKPPLLCNHNK